MNKQVYAVINEAVSPCGDSYNEVKLYDSKSKARSYFNELVRDFRENDMLNYSSNAVIEKSTNYFEAYEGGDYNNNHITFEIKALNIL